LGANSKGVTHTRGRFGRAVAKEEQTMQEKRGLVEEGFFEKKSGGGKGKNITRVRNSGGWGEDSN